jgi:thioredoxin-like negative regulator of GroEL
MRPRIGVIRTRPAALHIGLAAIELMNALPSIPEITADAFDGHVLRSELPVLVLFCADGDMGERHLLTWLRKWTAQATSLLNIARLSYAEARPLAARWGIPSIPSLALFHDGSVRYQFCGHFSHRELDEVLTRAAILGLCRHLGPPCERSAAARQERPSSYEQRD